MYRRDTGPHVAPFYERDVANFKTWYIGDRVPWAGDALERDTQRAGPWFPARSPQMERVWTLWVRW